MSAKYYTHFVMSRRPTANEFTGVVELTCPPRRGYNLREVATILAKSLHVQSADIRILHWSRLH
jgi:hypothetical protein